MVSQTTSVYALLGVVGTREKVRELLAFCRRRAFAAIHQLLPRFRAKLSLESQQFNTTSSMGRLTRADAASYFPTMR